MLTNSKIERPQHHHHHHQQGMILVKLVIQATMDRFTAAWPLGQCVVNAICIPFFSSILFTLPFIHWAATRSHGALSTHYMYICIYRIHNEVLAYIEYLTSVIHCFSDSYINIDLALYWIELNSIKLNFIWMSWACAERGRFVRFDHLNRRWTVMPFE